jgi:hypothetical protein
LQDFLQNSAGFVKTDLKKLAEKRSSVGHAPDADAQLKEIVDLNADISSMAGEYNKFRASKTLAGYEEQTKKRRAATLFDNTPPKPQFRCPDPVLDTALAGVQGAMQDLPEELHPQPIPGVVGNRATLEAFSRLGNFVLDLAPPISTILSNWQYTAPLVDKIRTLADDPAALQREAPKPAEPADRPRGLEPTDRLPLAVALLVDFCLFIATRPSRRIVIKGSPGAQNLASELRKLSSALDPESLFNDYVFSRPSGHYVFVPVGVGRGGEGDPDRLQRMRDRAMALAFASLDQPEVGLFKRKRIPSRFWPRKALLERGREYLRSHREYAVYRFYPNALQEMLGALIRHPETQTVDAAPVQKAPPRPAEQQRRTPPKPSDSGPASPAPRVAPPPTISVSAPRADKPAPPPRGKPPGI